MLAPSAAYFAQRFEGGMSNVGKRSDPASASRKRRVDIERVEPSRVGELERLREKVRKLETRLATVLDKTGQGVCLFDGSRRLVVPNAQYAELYGIAPEAIRPGMLLREILSLRFAAGSLPKAAQDDFLEWRDHVVAANKPSDSDVELCNGRIIRIHHEPLPDDGFAATHLDVTEHRRAEDELRRRNLHFDAAIANMSQGLCMFDANERMIVCNQTYLNMFALSPEIVKPGIGLFEILQHSVDTGVASDTADELYRIRREIIAACYPTTYCETLADGRIIDIWHRPMADGGWVSTYDDVTERRQAESRIAFMATHDALTSLPNRALLRDRLSRLASPNENHESLTALLLIDLDRFKEVNDTLGHAAGDKLLRLVALRLQALLGRQDLAARLGGDEFAILHHATDAGGTAALAQRIIDALVAPYELDGNRVNVGASIGISLAPVDGSDPEVLLTSADLALYRAKSRGRGNFAFFESDMTASAHRRRVLELELQQALLLGQFEVHYQPQVNLKTEQVTGAEALIRWRHPARGLVGPEEFISIAEEVGLIAPIGEWVMRQACHDAARWRDGMRVAVNLSAAQFRTNLAEMVTSALVTGGLPPTRLELEVTESVLLEETEATLRTLRQLRTLGVRISLDDFGTGYSSLRYLRAFPFDKIKIDRSFVGEIAADAHGAAIVQAIANLAASIGIETTAEGVETKEQLDLIRSKGCTEVQGFYFSPPRPVSE
ncbi:MAG TPA: EAL domain-containing protein [Roseiarcus sp.]|nr:EAL domain-containing protein [Roseiarcus sp.]